MPEHMPIDASLSTSRRGRNFEIGHGTAQANKQNTRAEIQSVCKGSGALAYAQDVTRAHEPPILGAHWARGIAQPAATSPNMTYHGGPILPSAAVETIFWRQVGVPLRGTRSAGWTDAIRI
jgi:hypothetical protein